MINLKKILFIVYGDRGKNYGLGHIKRCLNIYESLTNKKRLSFKLYFLTKKNSLGYEILKKNINKKNFNFIDINFLKKNKNFINKNDTVIIDNLGNIKPFRKLIKLNLANIISFDDIQNKYKKAILINGIFFTKKKLKRSKHIKLYQGLNYLYLDKSYIKKQYIKFKNKKNYKVLICSGGADYKNMTSKIINILRNIKNISLTVIRGAGIKKIKYKKFDRITFAKNPKSLKKYFQESDINIVSGGISMFESISCGKPTLVVKIYNHQKYAINFFAKKKSIIYLGNVDNIYSSRIKYIFSNLNILKNKFNKISRTGYKIIDAQGSIRVNKIINSTINA